MIQSNVNKESVPHGDSKDRLDFNMRIWTKDLTKAKEYCKELELMDAHFDINGSQFPIRCKEEQYWGETFNVRLYLDNNVYNLMSKTLDT